MQKIYIAGPYRAKTKALRNLNILVCKHAGILVAKRGHYPVIPCQNTAQFDDYAPDIEDQFWLDGTMAQMLDCDAVLMAQGWELSSGAMAERDTAIIRGMPVYYSIGEVPYADKDSKK